MIFRNDVNPASDTPVHEIWWRFLQERIDQLRAGLPRDLSGVVQFEVGRRRDPAAYFYLDVQGAKTSGADGRADSCDALVSTTEDEISELLFGEEPPQGLLRVNGNTRLVRDLLKALAAAPRTQSWVGIRSNS
jgi:hypothetical protein